MSENHTTTTSTITTDMGGTEVFPRIPMAVFPIHDERDPNRVIGAVEHPTAPQATRFSAIDRQDGVDVRWETFPTAAEAVRCAMDWAGWPTA